MIDACKEGESGIHVKRESEHTCMSGKRERDACKRERGGYM